MDRREFIELMGAAALFVARPAVAQTKTDLPLVGVLFPRTAEFAKNSIAALRQGLRQAGLVEGTNYSLAMRFADGDLDRLPQLAKELGELKPKVIVGSAGAANAIHKILAEQPWWLPPMLPTPSRRDSPKAMCGLAASPRETS